MMLAWCFRSCVLPRDLECLLRSDLSLSVPRVRTVHLIPLRLSAPVSGSVCISADIQLPNLFFSTTPSSSPIQRVVAIASRPQFSSSWKRLLQRMYPILMPLQQSRELTAAQLSRHTSQAPSKMAKKEKKHAKELTEAQKNTESKSLPHPQRLIAFNASSSRNHS